MLSHRGSREGRERFVVRGTHARSRDFRLQTGATPDHSVAGFRGPMSADRRDGRPWSLATERRTRAVNPSRNRISAPVAGSDSCSDRRFATVALRRARGPVRWKYNTSYHNIYLILWSSDPAIGRVDDAATLRPGRGCVVSCRGRSRSDHMMPAGLVTVDPGASGHVRRRLAGEANRHRTASVASETPAERRTTRQ